MDQLLNYICSAGFCMTFILVVAAIIFLILSNKVKKKYLKQNIKKGRKDTYINFLFNIVKFVVLAAIFIVALDINGINIASLLAGLGIAGIITGLALQDALHDIIMGYNIISSDFFAVGDIVRYNDVTGKVISFTLKSTKIYDIYTGNILTVCNRNISEIIKISDWLDIVIPTSYDADSCRMRTELSRLAENLKQIPKITDCAFLGTDELASSSVNYRLRLRVEPHDIPFVRRKALDVIYDFCRENNIVIPYTQIDIHSGN